MPNWCNNFIVIEGEEQDLQDFYSKATDDGFIVFSKLFPVPIGVNEDDWKIQNWTAHMNPSYRDDMIGLEFERNDSGADISLEGYFRTNNVPPHAWLVRVQQLYPSLKFSLLFNEPLSGLVGELYTLCDENQKPYIEVDIGKISRG